MTAKEALKILSGDFLDVKLADGESHADVYAAAFKMACEALEKADKYRWHDLRENPEDLPESDYKTCEVWLEGKIIDIAIWHDGVFVPWAVEYFQYCPPEWRKPVIAWKYIEPFEVTE